MVEPSNNPTINHQPQQFQPLDKPHVRQIWKLTRLIFRTIVTALLSISLAQLVVCLPSIAHRLDQLDGTSYRRQVDFYREFMHQSRDSPQPPQQGPTKARAPSIASTAA